MIRVVAVHQGGGIGGAPVSLLKLLQHLDQTAFQARAVFTESGPIGEYARELGVPATVCSTGGAFFYSAHARLNVRMLARFVRTFPGSVNTARRLLRREHPDVLHLNTSVLLAWAAAARRERVPVVWVVREVLGPNPLLRQWHAQFIVTRAARVVAISHAVAECFARPGAIRVVHNTVDLDDFRLDLLTQRTQLRPELGVSEGAKVIVVLGSVQRVKGHWLMLDALRELDDTELLLVGGGVASDYVRTWRGRIKRALDRPLDNLDALLREARARGVESRIHVTGFRRDVARVLAAADLLVFPSLQPEGFGRPIIEAMAMARPVVATAVGPSAELLGTDAGLLVQPNVASLVAAVAQVCATPEVAARMGAAGRRRVEACFSLGRQLAAMQSVYAEAADRG